MSASIPSSLSRTLMSIQSKASFGFALFFLIFGVTGCFLNILLFSRRQFRGVSCCIYFLAASVAMLIQLSFSAGTNLYSSYYEIPINYNSLYCKFWYYILQSTSIMSRWMLSAACLDRYAISSTHIRLRNLANVKNAYRILILNVIISLIFPIHILILYESKSRNCNIFNNYIGSLYSVIISIINTGIIPFIIMISCTLLIQKNLFEKRKRRLNLVQQQILNEEERKRDQQAFRMLFVQNIVFIIIITPWLIYNIYFVTTLNRSNKPIDQIIFEGFLSFVTGTCSLLFASISFYLYTLTSNLFRKELFFMLQSFFFCQYFKKNNQVTPIITQRISTK